MLAALLSTPGPIENEPLLLGEVPTPAPKGRELLIRVHACGLCHTDLHTVEGDIALPKLPVVPGHQIIGAVAAKGKRAGRFRDGDRVGIAWLRGVCGSCRHCRGGGENLCESAEFTGLHGDGGYAEYTLIEEDFAYRLPAGFSARDAAPLLCAGVIGYRALRITGVRPGERLGLYGFGASAHLVIQIARHWRCEVYVFTRSPAHQEHARGLGAAWVGRAEETPPEKLHGAIIFAPAGELVPHALRVLDRGGRLTLAGITMSPIPETNYALLYHEREVQSVANATRRDAAELLALAGEIPLSADTQVFALRDINLALRRLKYSEISGSGVIIVDEPTGGVP